MIERVTFRNKIGHPFTCYAIEQDDGTFIQVKMDGYPWPQSAEPLSYIDELRVEDVIARAPLKIN